jgi:hypothetical protein
LDIPTRQNSSGCFLVGAVRWNENTLECSAGFSLLLSGEELGRELILKLALLESNEI